MKAWGVLITGQSARPKDKDPCSSSIPASATGTRAVLVAGQQNRRSAFRHGVGREVDDRHRSFCHQHALQMQARLGHGESLELSESSSLAPGENKKGRGLGTAFSCLSFCARFAQLTLHPIPCICCYSKFRSFARCREAEAKMGRHIRTCPARRTWSTFFAESLRRRS